VGRMRSRLVPWALCTFAAHACARPLRVLPLGDSLTYGCGDQCDPAANCTHPPAYRHDLISVLGKDGLKGSHYHPGQSSGYGEVPCSRCSGGYRGELLKLLTAAGQDVELVGNLENDDGNGRHEGHIGWRIDQVTAAISKPGGIGLGHNGAGGHDVGRHAVPQLRAAAPGWEGRSHDAASGVRDYSSMDGGAGWARLQPDVILLHIGTNDIGQGADLDTVVMRTRELLQAIFGACAHPASLPVCPRCRDQANTHSATAARMRSARRLVCFSSDRSDF
jgi:lysophospholipase L1-like esterase